MTVEGTWQSFGKCATCPAIAEKALQAALQKARERNGGSITESTPIVEKKDQSYGSAGVISYSEMKLMDILKNLSKTYNSLVDKAKVPEEAWQPDKEFFVRDGTGVISGAIDQGLEEAKEIPELVGLGLSLVSDPEGAYNQLSTFAQQMDWPKAKTLAKEIAKGAVYADEFEKGGIYALHGTGRLGVTIALTVTAGGLLAVIADAPNQLKKKLDDALALIAKLPQQTQTILRNFSDETLVKFSNDLSDPAFFDWVNDAANEKYVRGFVNHKLTEADMQDIGGLLTELENLDDLPPQVKKWLENSQSSERFKYYRDLGGALNTNIKTALKSQFKTKSGILFEELKTQLGKTADELASYEILEEIPLNTSGGFMKADVMLIKKNSDGDIVDAIIIENKLSTGTQLTTRQKEGFGAIINGQTEMLIHNDVIGTGLTRDQPIPVSSQKIFKMYDHGTDDISKVSIQKITSTN